MIELQRHIQLLLLENECVIVPDFGGFIAHEVAAYYDNDDKMFLPPTRTLGFNPQLRINDSLLVQSYVDAYDLSYPEALRQIESEVAELRQQLAEQGSCLLEGLGTISVNQDSRYEFAPAEAGVVSPELYGLDGFTFSQLSDRSYGKPARKPLEEKRAVTAPPADSLLDFDDDDDDRAIYIKMSWIRNAVAVAAAIVAFFLISTPVANSDLDNQGMSQMQDAKLYKFLGQETHQVPAATPVAKEEVRQRQNTDTLRAGQAVTAAEQPRRAAQKATTYSIVVASQCKRSFAEAYVDKLHHDGFQSASLMTRNSTIRVILAEYPTEDEARQQLNRIRVSKEFAGAWIYKNTSEV